jgi:hypothetical protein
LGRNATKKNTPRYANMTNCIVQSWWGVEINNITGVTYIYVHSNMYIIFGKDK